ncbi:hypothetical protein GCM10009716_46730 [Streptomyces sodiiphilus]|uniref:Uncharacterized protein n=1 Tax=Streptomyces sodiiphilus TaxID=226217 RepID=A0ABN2PW91_9ACTN
MAQVRADIRDMQRPVNYQATLVGKIAASAAERMADEYGCVRESALSIDSLELPPPTPSAPRGEGELTPGQASDSCVSVKSVGVALDTLGVEVVYEHPVGLSLLETCLLVTESDSPIWLSAWYGPYATEMVLGRGPTWKVPREPRGTNEEKHPALRAWGSAECEGVFQTGRYALRTGVENDRDVTYSEQEREAQREILKAFAQESAERYGCAEPLLP